MTERAYWIHFLPLFYLRCRTERPDRQIIEVPCKAQTVLPSVRRFKHAPMVTCGLYSANHREL
ncbi:hypothetical protein DCO48_20455 [Pseudomonas sp. SDI]|nr:hypothetical protein DCO48_20455 [Pseudomonas sp. SDI]